MRLPGSETDLRGRWDTRRLSGSAKQAEALDDKGRLAVRHGERPRVHAYLAVYYDELDDSKVGSAAARESYRLENDWDAIGLGRRGAGRSQIGRGALARRGDASAGAAFSLKRLLLGARRARASTP